MAHQGRKNADEVLLLALACGATLEQAAAKVDVSRSTVARRMASPQFRKRLAAVKADMVCRTGAALTAAGAQAVKKLLSATECQMRMNHANRIGSKAGPAGGVGQVVATAGRAVRGNLAAA